MEATKTQGSLNEQIKLFLKILYIKENHMWSPQKRCYPYYFRLWLIFLPSLEFFIHLKLHIKNNNKY